MNSVVGSCALNPFVPDDMRRVASKKVNLSRFAALFY